MSENIFNGSYVRRVGGEPFTYRLRYNNAGETIEWAAEVFENGDLKGTPSGTIVDNDLAGDALRQYVVSYLEGIIERGMGIAE